MCPQGVAAAEKHGFDFALGNVVSAADLLYGVAIPIPADKHITR